MIFKSLTDPSSYKLDASSYVCVANISKGLIIPSDPSKRTIIPLYSFKKGIKSFPFSKPQIKSPAAKWASAIILRTVDLPAPIIPRSKVLVDNRTLFLYVAFQTNGPPVMVSPYCVPPGSFSVWWWNGKPPPMFNDGSDCPLIFPNHSACSSNMVNIDCQSRLVLCR